MKYILAAILTIIITVIFYKVTEKLCDWIDKWGETMWKIKDNVDLKELEKFGYKIIPEGIYAKSIKRIHPMQDANVTEYFIAVEKDRTLKKYEVWSYLNKAFYQKERHLFKFYIKELIKAGLVEKVDDKQ